MQATMFNPVFVRPVMSRLMDRMMTHPVAGDFENGSDFSSLPGNIIENNGRIELQMAAPGWEKEDVQIRVEKDQLVISMEKQQKEEEKADGKWIRREFFTQKAKRRFHLHKSIDTERIEATYTNGVLTVVLPKKEADKDQEVRRIEIL